MVSAQQGCSKILFALIVNLLAEVPSSCFGLPSQPHSSLHCSVLIARHLARNVWVGSQRTGAPETCALRSLGQHQLHGCVHVQGTSPSSCTLRLARSCSSWAVSPRWSIRLLTIAAAGEAFYGSYSGLPDWCQGEAQALRNPFGNISDAA